MLTYPANRPCIGLQNSADGFVVSGRPESVARACGVLSSDSRTLVESISESVARACGVLSDTVKDANGQTPENLLWRLDVEQARGIAHNILMDPVDWVAECRRMAALGVRRILEIGPSGSVAMLTQVVLDGERIEVLDVSGAEGKTALFGG